MDRTRESKELRLALLSSNAPGSWQALLAHAAMETDRGALFPREDSVWGSELEGRDVRSGSDGTIVPNRLSGTVTKFHRYEATFLREVTALSHLQHPCIVELMQVIVPQRACRLPLYDSDLMQVLLWQEDAPHARVDASVLAKSLLEALDFCHARHFVHLDVKPDNILVAFDPLRYVLCDFGRSVHLVDEHLCPVEELCVSGVGTRIYAAPEAGLHGRCMPSNDCWAAGIVLFCSLEREFPFEDPMSTRSSSGPAEKDLRASSSCAYRSDVRQTARSLVEAGDPELFPKRLWPSWALETIRGLLRISPLERWSAKRALQRVEESLGGLQ